MLEANGLQARFPTLDRPLDEEEMVDLVADCDALVVGVDPVTAAVLDAAPLKVVVKYGSGTDNIDLPAAEQRRIPLLTTGAENAVAVAELALGFLFTLARQISALDRSVKAGGWSRLPAVELTGRRLGIVGYGAIGRELGERASGLGMDVVAHDPLVTSADVPMVALPELLTTSDFVSLHLPLTPTTSGLIDRAAIEAMRPGSFLVNVARGGLVDEEALADAIASGHLAGAALDCFAQEPPATSNRLLGLDRVVATPHCGAATTDAVVRAGTRAVDLVLQALTPAPVGPSPA